MSILDIGACVIFLLSEIPMLTLRLAEWNATTINNDYNMIYDNAHDVGSTLNTT